MAIRRKTSTVENVDGVAQITRTDAKDVIVNLTVRQLRMQKRDAVKSRLSAKNGFDAVIAEHDLVIAQLTKEIQDAIAAGVADEPI